MKKIVLLLALAMTVHLSYSQGREPFWEEGLIYEEKGNDVYIPVTDPYPVFDKFGKFIGERQTVQISLWHEKYFKGDVHVWNKGTKRWNVVQKEGLFWCFTWKPPEEIIIPPQKKEKGKTH